MSGVLTARIPVVLLVFLCAFAVQAARADGEVGLVIEKDGHVTTYCVPYQGDGISGDDLLEAAGLSYEDLGSGAGSALCAIEDTGCFNPSSFNSCFCQCAGGADCVYWAFFTRDYGGGWVYSTRAFDRTTANDGDVHAWRWGKGSLNSAPRPSDSVSFEAVCGHAPRGGVAPTGTQPAASTTSPAVTDSQATPVPATGTAEQPFTPLPSASAPEASVSVTLGGSPAETATASSQPLDAGRDDDGGGSPAGLIGFGAVAAILVALVGAAALWRKRHGS